MTKHPPLASDLLLSVHIPKTGGITLFNLLEQRFGKGLVSDYPDRKGLEGRTDLVEAIHGHFEISKYLELVPGARIVTFLREPLDRAISHFYYWLDPPAHVPKDDPVYLKYFVEKEPRLEEFLLARELSNICTSFLHPLDHPEQFWFVGFQETFAEDIARLQRMLGMRVRKQPILNPGKPRPKMNLPEDVIGRFYELNWRDKAFYDLMYAKFKRVGSISDVDRNKILHLRNELQKWKTEYAGLESNYNKLKEAYQRMEGSKSWKLTKPLRWLAHRYLSFKGRK